MDIEKFFNLLVWLFLTAITIKGMRRKWLSITQYSKKSINTSFVDHICDRRFDGMCVKCQMKAGKAIISQMTTRGYR